MDFVVGAVAFAAAVAVGATTVAAAAVVAAAEGVDRHLDCSWKEGVVVAADAAVAVVDGEVAALVDEQYILFGAPRAAAVADADAVDVAESHFLEMQIGKKYLF